MTQPDHLSQKQEYGKHFREVLARIQKLPERQRSAMSNRPETLLPKRPSRPERTA